jgi:hypothetical protein
MFTGVASVNEKSNKPELKKVPLRQLIAAVKQGIRKELRPSMSDSKPKNAK